MKKLILASLVASATAITALPTYAQTDNDAVVQEVSTNNIIDVLNNATAETSSEQLREDLVEAIRRICKNKEEVKLDDKLFKGACGSADMDAMVATVVANFGVDSPLISDFLAALSDAGFDSDAITLSAITAGIDPTVASEATAAGPGAGPAPSPVVSLPTLPTPPGAGGTGGDAGISEVEN
ncbi:hypothetical protein [Pseudoalteromonas sp. L1]|uniref:hypothetical protein n=1 Tax=unclassified Pseudoalteromonas TaxID=194690 RepID=UPI001F34420B|nr:hypothetical protein [Pseudoalteromonas sp. L1]